MKTSNVARFFAMALIFGFSIPAYAAETQRIIVLDTDRAVIDRVDMRVRDMNGTFSVDAENGKVTLIGLVKDKTTMDRIVDTVRKTPGVESVDNQLRVDPAYASMGTAYTQPLNVERQYAPDIIETNVRYNLRPYADVTTSFDDGVVTMTGHVPTEADKMLAARLVSRIQGVSGIQNDLVVK